MTQPARRTMASLLLISALILSACAAEPEASSSSSPTATPSMSASPSPSLTPQPVAQAFGGDCGAMLTDDEVAELIGEPIQLDTVEEARERLGLEASLVWAGGIVCDWESERERLQVIVMPRDIVPAGQDPDDADVNGAPCASVSVQCRWIAASGSWWVHAAVFPVAEHESWIESPEAAETVGVKIDARVGRWSPPADRAPEGARFADCETTLSEVSSMIPDAGVAQRGAEVGVLDFLVITSQLALGCPWEIPAGAVWIRVQPSLGAFESEDLSQANAEDYALPSGRNAHRTVLSPYWATLMTVDGDTRYSVSGSGVSNDPAASARVLEAAIVASTSD